jgi:hypothetical protein
MSTRRILSIALFMFAAFLGLQGLGAPDWASVLVSVAVGEFLWSKERKRAAREIQNTWLQQMIMSQGLMLEMKLSDMIAQSRQSDIESTEIGAEEESKIHLI